MEGKFSMSDPLLGEAGPPRPEPALADGNGAHDVPATARVWAGPGDESQDGASDEPIENDKAPKRRRRGSRGGRGRRGATVVLVDGSEGPEGEEAVPAPVPVLEMEGLEVERSPAPAVAATVAGATVLAGRPEAVVTVKPRIGDTRPGSPPAPPKRRARKEGPRRPKRVVLWPTNQAVRSWVTPMMPRPRPVVPDAAGACRAMSGRSPTRRRGPPPTSRRRTAQA